MIKTITTGMQRNLLNSGCGECQTSCQSACKTSCGIANQHCENLERQNGVTKEDKEGGGTLR